MIRVKKNGEWHLVTGVDIDLDAKEINYDVQGNHTLTEKIVPGGSVFFFDGERI